MAATTPFLASPARGMIIKTLIISHVAVLVLYFAAMCIYLGATFQPEVYSSNLKVKIVDFDHGVVGATFTQFMRGVASQPNALGYEFPPSSEYNDDPRELSRQVDQGTDKVYAAIYVRAGASSAYMNALRDSTTLPSYNPAAALTMIYDESRNPLLNGRVAAPLRVISTTFVGMFATSRAPKVLSMALNDTQVATILLSHPYMIAAPVSFTIQNLHPTLSSVLSPATNVGFIYGFVFCFVLVNVIWAITDTISGTTSAKDIWLIRFTCLTVSTFIITLLYTILLSIFQLQWLSAGRWFAVWGVMFLLISQSGYILAFAMTTMGTRTAFFMILYLVSNIIPAFNSLDIMSRFYQWFYIWPFYHAVTALRTIVFDSFDQLHINLPSLVAWWIFSLGLFILSSVHRHRQQQKQAQQINMTTPSSDNKEVEMQGSV
eukprot:TRINITY_DN4739_c0_g1_i2.p1 TRINITY_DN4739_c0_g1~~TRINITY_DN4739_c0_g1_i2.p1  ORF type:complete len:432 (-),score=62.72 TRINITY_DN4739_c0_g1_i2:63-1358(-)